MKITETKVVSGVSPEHGRAFRLSFAILGILAATAVQAFAGMQVTLKMEHKSLILHEPVNAFVSLVNDSDDLVILGSEKGLAYDKLYFVLRQGKNDTVLSPTSSNAITGKIKLMPDDKHDELIDLGSFYDLTTMGNYIVSAVVDIKGKKYESNRVSIDIVSGIELTSVTKGLPDVPGESRKCTLRYWQRDGENSLFLVVENDQTKQPVAIFSLGSFIRINKPVLTCDRHGNVTIVHQRDPDVFVKSTFKLAVDRVTFVDSVNQNEEGVPYVPEVAEPAAPAAKPDAKP